LQLLARGPFDQQRHVPADPSSGEPADGFLQQAPDLLRRNGRAEFGHQAPLDVRDLACLRRIETYGDWG
jgi:hypothetical protein